MEAKKGIKGMNGYETKRMVRGQSMKNPVC